MTHGTSWMVVVTLPVLVLLGCGTPRERCLDPDVCDALMTDVGLPLTHEWRGSAEFEADGAVHTYAEVRYAGRGDLPGATMCLLWDGSVGRGRVVFWTTAFTIPGFVGCVNGHVPDLPNSCAYPDGLGPLQHSAEFYDFATSDSTLPGPFSACRRELWSRQEAGTWPDPRGAAP